MKMMRAIQVSAPGGDFELVKEKSLNHKQDR